VKYGYVRVSKDDRVPVLQLAALKKAGCNKVFKYDGLSGATAKRPALAALSQETRTWRQRPHRDNLSALKDGGLSAFSVPLLLNTQISALRDGAAH
jgi:hypothetical protein